MSAGRCGVEGRGPRAGSVSVEADCNGGVGEAMGAIGAGTVDLRAFRWACRQDTSNPNARTSWKENCRIGPQPTPTQQRRRLSNCRPRPVFTTSAERASVASARFVRESDRPQWSASQGALNPSQSGLRGMAIFRLVMSV
ncbi:hypothetical protein BN873_1010004 [Candidatus Competibacter denitrificans Run_A_D11]|uniref:Uncharacterized protein n=1 Tax=Candidatus Competibacter denitrificans Run_A_D11 TaxID=1400863 RepID=W6M162_9GAMM|nr:hypothetical protein BN873_1010004 [Candidatus Competibacter denitrificans Run_A_D11]